MGRAPCCDKANVKKGPWSPEEDAKLKSYIEQHGTGGNWIALPQKIGLKRCGKSCRLRWLNYLRPNIKHGGFSQEEDNIICSLYISIGSRWSVIAAQLPGRTDNDIKNYWNTRLKKKLLGKHRKEQQQQQQAARNNRGNMNGVVKQGIGNNNNIGDSSSSSLLMVPENSTSPQQPYWPVLPPVPYTTNQLLGPSFNDQDSIRKLLIKLGGRFSDDDYQPTTLLDGVVVMNNNNNNNNLDHPFPIVSPSTQQVLLYEEQQVHVNNNSVVQFSQISNNNNNNNNQYCSDEVVQGEGIINNFSAAVGEEMVSSAAANYPQRLLDHGGMEFFYGEDMVVTDSDNKIIGTTATTDNWGETSSTKIYPPSLVASNYRPQPQECVFQHYYPGPQ